ncbi:hypothetical protein IMSHALPRED_004383 [Imshaugia aleurites]|uniref:Pentatricopeptide repeat-containing protein n=1 Tax=Imshaugia aleurites TaxID=172621 RepID=A0A8H3FD88_9LECA|nr:hypothetical protein IMSHALPRED_004383 [Imshaugia aleurites]
MNVPYVWLRCSRQLLRWRTQYRRSGFVSLGQLAGRDDDSRRAPQDVPLANGERSAVGLPRQKQRSTLAQSLQEQRKPKDVDKVLETLFASNREREQAVKRSRYSRTPQVQPLEAPAVEHSIKQRLWELRKNLHRGTLPLEKIWRDCESLLGEKRWVRTDKAVVGGDETLSEHDSTSIDSPTNLNAFRDVLLAVCRKQRLVIDGRDITPGDAIAAYMKHGAMRYWWHHVLWCQLGQVLQLRYQSTDDTLGAAPDPRLRVLMQDILIVWNMYMEKYGDRSGNISLPFLADCNEVPAGFSTSEPIPRSSAKQSRLNAPVETTVAAAMTLECLTAAGMNTPWPIVDLFGRFGHAVKRDRSIATRCLLRAGVSSEITGKAVEGWQPLSSSKPEEIPEIPKSTEKPNGSRVSKDPVGASQKTDDLDWSENGLRTRLADIDGASKRVDTGFAVDLWRRFQAHLAADKSEDRSDPNDHLYARFLRTFWALRRYDHAIEVWNHMINAGHPPSRKHWNAMLTGCIRARDVESLQRIWSNMLRSGMPPDTTAWTTYIHGLIVCHEWVKGLKALESLGRLWKSTDASEAPTSAVEGRTGNNTAENEQNAENEHNTEPKEETMLRPTLTPINAALSALIQINKRSLLPRVLAWAQSHQIALSTYTFNVLLRPLVRHGSQAAVQAHLQQMGDANCTPDVVTFSIILNGLVSNVTSTFHNLPPEAQESTITSLLADMGRQGIEPNPFTYGTLLDGLLTPGSRSLSHNFTPNVPAARTILAHMAARNLHPSPHIYTILIEHYFARRPVPDLPAIASLWSSIRHAGQTNKLDNIFYDRLIEGYARSDEIEDMLRFLRMVPEQGKSPGWGALVQVLRALITNREWGRCAEVVEDVEREGGLLRNGQGRVGGREKAEFWDLVAGLRERGVVGKGDEER